MFTEFKADLESLISRTEHVEKKSEFAIDSHSTLEEELAHLALALSSKVPDLEDCSRQNNIHIRGIPEHVQPDPLRSFLTYLMAPYQIVTNLTSP